jgi:hypothetical protein
VTAFGFQKLCFWAQAELAHSKSTHKMWFYCIDHANVAAGFSLRNKKKRTLKGATTLCSP